MYGIRKQERALQSITPTMQIYSVLCNAMPDDSRITARIEFDFENGTAGIYDRREKEWKLYQLDDVADTVDRAGRKRRISLEAKREIFEEALAGKEIDLWEESGVEVKNDAPTQQM